SVELRLRRTVQHRRTVRVVSAQEDRHRPRADDPHLARGGLCPQAPALARRGFRSPRSWSLRARLLASQIVLLALVCAAIGVGTEFALQRFLMNQLDDRLAETGRRSTGLFEFGPPPPPPGMGPMMPGYPDPPGYPRRVIIRDDYGPGPAF